jgi:DNA-3-methyladenine glycosylase
MSGKLPLSFYQRDDVLAIARDLLGKIIVTSFNSRLTSGRIVETEAYRAFSDRASHSFGGRRTKRNEHMYGPGSISYVYICYGLHHLVNVVTNLKDVPEAVLIRAVEPLQGIDIMLARTGKKDADDPSLTRGPGNVSRALGIRKEHSGLDLRGSTLYILEGKLRPDEEIVTSARIGVESAGEDALLPYRFFIRGNAYVSGKKG